MIDAGMGTLSVILKATKPTAIMVGLQTAPALQCCVAHAGLLHGAVHLAAKHLSAAMC